MNRAEALADLIKPVEEIGKSFTDPDDDWTSVALMAPSDDRPTALLVLTNELFGSEESKDRLSAALTKFIRDEKITALAMLNSTWVAKVERKPGTSIEQRASEIGPPSEHPEREEMLLIVSMDADGADSRYAMIERHEGAPPTLSEWKDDLPGDQMMGRFILPFRDALKAVRRELEEATS